jgi:hypothetical protein
LRLEWEDTAYVTLIELTFDAFRPGVIPLDVNQNSAVPVAREKHFDVKHIVVVNV